MLTISNNVAWLIMCEFVQNNEKFISIKTENNKCYHWLAERVICDLCN